MSVGAPQGVGVDLIMTCAAAERPHRVAELDLKEQFRDVVPVDFRQALESIEDSLAGRR